MYIHLLYYSGERSLVENIGKIEHADITGDKVFFLDAVDNDVDALRFQHNNGGHFDVIFLHEKQARAAYEEIIKALRRDCSLLELDIRDMQTAGPEADAGAAAPSCHPVPQRL